MQRGSARTRLKPMGASEAFKPVSRGKASALGTCIMGYDMPSGKVCEMNGEPLLCKLPLSQSTEPRAG